MVKQAQNTGQGLTDLKPSQQELLEFQIGKLADEPSIIKKFIFSHTGHASEKMTFRKWCMFNTSLNLRLDMGMDQTTVAMLSLMDESLQYAHRFAGMPHVHELQADSTAAHSAQVVRTIYQVFKETFSRGMKPPEEAKVLCREAMVGAKIHDMGEIFGEPCTASEFFSLSVAERATISIQKNDFEQQNFEFACALASHAVRIGNFGLFTETMKQVRDEVAPALAALEMRKLPEFERVQQRIEILTHARDRVRKELQQQHPELGTLLPQAEALLDIYHRTEEQSPGNFLHPFVKSLESIEGQRYLQRNSQEPATANLCYQTSFDTIESCWRAERRLPILFEAADTSWKQKLAQHTAAYVYASLARGFDGLGSDGCIKESVSLAPSIIHRNIDRSETPTAAIKLECLAGERARTQKLLLEKIEQGAPDAADGRIVRREDLAAWYRGAQHAVTHHFYVPKQASLARFADTPTLPNEITSSMETLAREKPPGIVPIGSRPGRKR